MCYILKKKYIKFFILFYVLPSCLFLLLYHRQSKNSAAVRLQYVVVHIDLKGSPPKLRYLESLLPTLRILGVNGLLIEYEDMFPYDGELADARARNCYQKSELQEFLRKATRSGFEIIPLVQTFGHLEYVLKLKKFKHLREVAMYPDTICPSKVQSRVLIQDMLQQVIEFHSSISPLKHIHIGCDEVYRINQCEQCRGQNLTNIDIFLPHVKIISDIVKDVSPEIKVLIWDDMLRNINLKTNGMDIEPVYWSYENTVSVSHFSLFQYHKTFKDIWLASAFKGADGPTAVLPDLTNRFSNHVSWMSLISKYKFGGEHNVYSFKGIILTGWSRYSSMEPLCELLPASIPSLLLNLLVVKKFKEGVIKNEHYDVIYNEFSDILDCENKVDLKDFDLSHCDFDGKDLYSILLEFTNLSKEIKTYLSYISLSSIEYYASKNHLNVNHITHHMFICSRHVNNLVDLEQKLSTVMSKYYDAFVINEYVNYKTYDLKKQLMNLIHIFDRYLLNDFWEN